MRHSSNSIDRVQVYRHLVCIRHDDVLLPDTKSCYTTLE